MTEEMINLGEQYSVNRLGLQKQLSEKLFQK